MRDSRISAASRAYPSPNGWLASAYKPLGSKAGIGFLAIGSVDANRFHPGMSTDFLERIGELVGLALSARKG